MEKYANEELAEIEKNRKKTFQGTELVAIALSCNPYPVGTFSACQTNINRAMLRSCRVHVDLGGKALNYSKNLKNQIF